MSFSAGSIIARASSGSRSCSSSVDPLMSANSAVTVLRSPSIASRELLSDATRIAVTAVAADETGDAGAISAFPQSPQNFSAGSLEAPQRAHLAAIGAPHCAQNLRPSRLSTPHLLQRILPPARCYEFSSSSSALASFRSAVSKPSVNQL